MRNSIATKNYFAGAILVLALTLFGYLPDSAQAIRGGSGYNRTSIPRMTSRSRVNRYEIKIIKNQERQEKYQRKLAKYHWKLKVKQLNVAKKRRAAIAKKRQKRLKEQRVRETRLAKTKTQTRVAKAKASKGKINYARKGQKERSMAANGRSKQVGPNEPENPSVIQRLRYAFTGRY